MEKNSIKNEILKIGVTGHRIIENEDLIRLKVKEILGVFDDKLSPNSILRIISPLAEGADRIVAQEVLFHHESHGKSELHVVLPLKINDYLNDFKTIESKKEFKELIDLAQEIVSLKEAPTRKDAYLQAGRYVVDHCNVLIAVWDGKPSRGKGGTADIIEYAMSLKKMVFWINSIDGKIKHL